MARPRTDPMIRYADVARVLNFASDNGGVAIHYTTDNEAIMMLQRFNTYRKIIRENNDGLTVLDNFVFARRGTTIKIYPRPFTEPTTIYGLDGKPLLNEFNSWEENQRQRYMQRHGAFTTPQPPTGAPESNPHDPNPFTQDKPLKLNDD